MKKTTMKKTAAAFALVIAAAGGFAATRGGALPTTAHAESNATAGSASAAPTVPELARDMARDLRLGRSFTYDIGSEIVLASGGRVITTNTLSGRLLLTVVGAAEGNATVRGQLEGAQSGGQPGLATPERAGLGAEFFFFLRADGAITGFAFPKSIPGESRRYLRALVSSLQVVVSDAGSARAAPSWDTKENDSSGEFAALYLRRGETIEKAKSRYDLVRTPKGLVTPASIGGAYEVHGGLRATLGVGNWPSNVDVDETLTATFSTLRFSSTEKTHVVLAADGERNDLLGTYDRAKASFDPDVDGTAEGEALALRNADEGLVRGATFGSLVSDFASATDGKGRGRAVARLAALFRTRPEAVADARSALLSKTTPEATARSLAAALGGAGTPAAQRALGEALRSADTTAGTKTESAISLGLVSKPTSEAKSALLEASKSSDGSVADTSTLALGNLAKASADSGDEARDVVDDLLARLAAATTLDEKALALDALGNAGSQRALDAILAYTSSAETDLRAAAVGALKYMTDGRAAQAILAGTMDAESRVRMAGLQAIAQQSVLPFIEGLDFLLEHDHDAQVRLLAVRIAARSMDQAPEIEAILVRVSTNDSDEKVKAAATEALSRPRRASAG